MNGIVDPYNYEGIVDVFGEPLDLLVPLNGGLATAQNSTMLSGWSVMNPPTDITTAGALATLNNPRACILGYRCGYIRRDLNTESLIYPMPAGTGSVSVMGALKARYALVERDAPWEIDNTKKGVPNGNLLATTGAGITWNTARSNWSTNQSQYARFPWSGGDISLKKGTPVALFMAFEVAFTNAGVTPAPEVPEENIWGVTLHDMPYNRPSRLGAAADRLGCRPSIWQYDTVAGGIDNINWLGNLAGSAGVSLPIINHTGHTDGQLHGSTHWNGAPSYTTTGDGTTSWALTSGKFIYCAPLWGPYSFMPAEGPY